MTGAIFARGSCRALKWTALFGVLFSLGAGSAAAQTITIDSVKVNGTLTEGNTVTAEVKYTLTAGDNDVAAATNVTVGFGYSLTEVSASDAAATQASDTSFIGLSQDLSANQYTNVRADAIDSGEKDTFTYTHQFVLRHDLDAEDAKFKLNASVNNWAGISTAVSKLSSVVTIKDDEEQTYTLSIPAANKDAIMEGAATATNITLKLNYPRTARATVPDFTVVVEPNNPGLFAFTEVDLNTEANENLLIAPGAVTTGAKAADIKALDDTNRMDGEVAVKLYAGIALEDTLTLTVTDVNKLPPAADYTVTAYDAATGGNVVTEVDEGGMVWLEVEVDRGDTGYPSGEDIKVALSLSPAGLATLATSGEVTVGDGTGKTKGDARVRLDALSNATVDAAQMLAVNFTATGATAAKGSESVSGMAAELTVNDATTKQVFVQADAEAKINAAKTAAAGADGQINPDDNISILKSDLFGNAPGYTVDVTASSSNAAVATVDDNDAANIVVMPQSAGTVTITARGVASPTSSSFTSSQTAANVAEITFDVTVVGARLEVPGAPTGLIAEAGDGEAMLSWKAASGKVDSYEYEQDSGAWTAIKGSTAATTKHTVGG